MSYYIDIIDILSPLVQIVPKSSSAKGIVLEWNGSDTKDEQTIIGSNLKFDMLTVNDDDMAFIDFFTGDEHRFLTQVKDSTDNSIVWQGYILPDLYSEPYKAVNFFVSFTASDGLGRLKGKYLPAEYYTREKSVIDIFCQILRLTGLDLELYFAPAIENFLEKSWTKIYIDTESFIDSKKQKDAYKIFETLLQDTLCVCYQCDNRWYIEGLNQRNVRNVNYKVYNTSGIFVKNVVYNRLLKKITSLVTPFITIVPPYNEITVTHKKIEPSLPKTLSKEVNDGWAVVTGVKGIIYGSEWVGNGGLNAICEKPDYYTRIYNQGYFTGDGSISYPYDRTRYVSLKEKIFLSKGQKVTLNFEFNIVKYISVVSDVIDYDLWKNPFQYEILLNDDVIFANFKAPPLTTILVSENENILFEESENLKKEFQHIVLADSLLDIRFYAPFGSLITNKIIAIELRSAEISIAGFEEEEVVKDLINGDFTIDKEVELTFSDDKSGVSKGFRLAKLKEQTTFFNNIQVPILYAFVLSGRNYAVVQLDGANLINQNKYTVYFEDILVNVLNVFYNFNDGEQMVIETSIPFTTGNFTVKKYAVDDVVASRLNWLQWTDAIYKIENTSYSKTVANIYRRLFNKSVEKLDVTAFNAVKFNDIVLFKYVYVKDFFVLNCSWNLDENKTTLTLGRSYYKEANSTTPGDENIPPIVLAGSDIYLTNTQTTTSMLATAFDPDGYIASQIWTKIFGGFGDIIVSQFALGTQLDNLTEDYYTYQIQVTDNDGATALDTINVIRSKNYSVNMSIIYANETENELFSESEVKYQLVVDPALPSDFVLSVKGFIKYIATVSRWTASSYIVVEKNGIVLEEYSYYADFIDPLVLNFIATDEIFITVRATANAGTLSGEIASYATSTVVIALDTASFINGVGTIINLPSEVEVRASIRE